jgi:hypothetical protein
MNGHVTKGLDTNQERQRLMNDMITGHGPQWAEHYKSGSFGCHELLDRTSLVADIVGRHVLSRPACVQDRDWFALAEQAVTALREMYERMGETHLCGKNDVTGHP